jgi:hypothetical protein
LPDERPDDIEEAPQRQGKPGGLPIREGFPFMMRSVSSSHDCRNAMALDRSLHVPMRPALTD